MKRKSDHNRSDELLLGALASGSSVEQAAVTAGISTRTAYRRLASAQFAKRLAQARDELISNTLGELIECATEAVATLRGLLNSPDDRVRLNAAKCTLEQLLRLRETLTLNERLRALERAVQTRERRQR